MKKKLNLCFSLLGLFAEIFYLFNAFNIWVHNIGVSISNIVNSIFSILIVFIGFILTIVSMIFYKDNYRASNIINYISIIILVVATCLIII